MKQKLGFIGLGVMGQSMCANLMKDGHEMHVYTRTKSTATEILKLGAIWCDNSKEVAEKADIIFTIVGFPKDVEQVYMEKDGVLAGASKGKIVVDMTTSEPTLAQTIYEHAKKKGVSSLDAPVSGGDVGAKNGTLAIMIGGDKETYDKVLPLFKNMGKNIAYMGKAGAGQHTKMSNQILIAGTMIGVVESLLYAYKAGNDLQEVINVIGSGAAGCWSINNLGPRIVKGNFDPGFFIKHFVKDMKIALREADLMNLSLPGLALVYQFYKAAMAVGLENLGTHGLYKVFEMMNGVIS
ncbi:MAG: NAD(P)-dependent oxidoreductase [Candidatus Lokiarchaeota archaeon]|nr:NAD(P)-dependent oxidoreductase [Candidatus Lokiarchaeota archaeon]